MFAKRGWWVIVAGSWIGSSDFFIIFIDELVLLAERLPIDHAGEFQKLLIEYFKYKSYY